MVDAVLFLMIKVFYFYIITIFLSTCALPSVAVFCSSSNSCFSGLIAQVLSGRFCDALSCPRYYWYLLCFYIPHALHFCCGSLYFRIFVASSLITFLPPEFGTSIGTRVPFSWSRFFGRDDSVRLYLLIPQYGWFTWLFLLILAKLISV
jgi:hypothetical protein